MTIKRYYNCVQCSLLQSSSHYSCLDFSHFNIDIFLVPGRNSYQGLVEKKCVTQYCTINIHRNFLANKLENFTVNYWPFLILCPFRNKTVILTLTTIGQDVESYFLHLGSAIITHIPQNLVITAKHNLTIFFLFLLLINYCIWILHI